jgi:hypothetical protein
MNSRYLQLSLIALILAVAPGIATKLHAHGLQILLDSDGAGGLQAAYGFGPHARVTGVQIGEALLWDERARYAPNYPTLAIGTEQRITWEGQEYLIQYDPSEWDNQLEWRIAPQSTDFPGITPLRGGFEAIATHYGDDRLDLRVNLHGRLRAWDGSAFVPAADASVSLTSQDWPTPPDGFWYVELHDEVTSSAGMVSTVPYDLAGVGFDDGEHWHYLWTLNGPDDTTPAADGVYLAQYTISSGDGGLESAPMWLLLRQGVLASSATYLAAEAAAIAAVPEPTTLAVAVLGLSALGLRRWRA